MKNLEIWKPRTWDEAVSATRANLNGFKASWAWEGETIFEDPKLFEEYVLKGAAQLAPELIPAELKEQLTVSQEGRAVDGPFSPINVPLWLYRLLLIRNNEDP